MSDGHGGAVCNPEDLCGFENIKLEKIDAISGGGRGRRVGGGGAVAPDPTHLPPLHYSSSF